MKMKKKAKKEEMTTTSHHSTAQRIAAILTVIVITAAMSSGIVFAQPPWMAQVRGFLQGAAWLIGGGLVVAGVIMYGIGQSKDDASQKSTGIMMAAGGIIVAAAGALIPTLFTFTAGTGA